MVGKWFDLFLSTASEWEAKPCVQVFTFGQHRKTDLGNNHRPLWRLKRKDAPLYPDAIKVPSWRQRNGDKRAAAGGRVPGDVFDMQYIDHSAATWPGDVLDFPRVTGNSKQRCDWHPTQLHEDLVERCIKLSTPEYGSVLDPFGGTGTTLRVCKSINRSCTLIEKSAGYCDKIREAHPEISLS
jgi:DNA modification methylase